MITQKRLHDLFEYRKDGNLIWKVSISNRVKIGDIVGYIDSGQKPLYRRTQLDGKKHRVHRLIFLYHYGHITPGMDIDHIDGNSLNNRIDNLREATRSQNLQNSKISSNNTSGVKGVLWDKKYRRWEVRLSIEGKVKYLGQYKTLEEAEAVVKEARVKYHGEYARHE
jgi:hypothetical protein